MKLHFLLVSLLCFCSPLIAMREFPESRFSVHAAIGKYDLVAVKKAVAQGLTEYIYDSLGLVEIIDHGPKATLNMPNLQGRSPLHYAVIRNCGDITAYLVHEGADMYALDAQKRNAFHLAAAYGRVRILGFLRTQHTFAGVTPEHKTLMHSSYSASKGSGYNY